MCAAGAALVPCTLDAGLEPQRWWLSLALAAAALVVLARRVPAARPRRAGAVALVCAGGWATWSALSVAWAQDPAWAWTAAGRAWLLTAVLGLVLLWPGTATPALRARLAAVVVAGVASAQALAGWGLAFGGDALADGRMRGGLPYANAFAMLMAAGALAALGRAGASRGSRAARGGWTAVAVALLATALAAQSRSSLPALAAGLLVAAAIAARPRMLLVPVLLVLGATTLTAPAVLAVRRAALDGDASSAALRAALVVAVVAAAAGAVAALGRAGSFADDAGHLPARGRRRILLGLAVAAALVPAFVAVASAPPDYERIETASTRFAAGTSSNRPDMWRVTLGLARDHPVLGVGAGSFQRPYLRLRHSSVAPRFAHSAVAEPLATLGVPGLLLVLGLLSGLVAGALAARPRGVAACGLSAAGCAVLAQALVDWSTELPVVGLVAVLALAACHDAPDDGSAGAGFAPARALVAAALAATVLLAATGTAPDTPAGTALDRLALAARLWPVDARPLESRALVALRAGEPAVARRAADAALARDPDGWLALWLRGAIDVQDGRFAAARPLLARAARHNPRERAIALTRSAARRGERLDVLETARRILDPS